MWTIQAADSRHTNAPFRRKIDVFGIVVNGRTATQDPPGMTGGGFSNLMVRAGGFTGPPAFPLRGRC